MNPLQHIPAQYRGYVYALLSLAALVLAGYQASQGDWVEFFVFVLGGLGFGTAKTHTPRD